MSMKKKRKENKGGTSISNTAEGKDTKAKLGPP